MWLKFRGYPRCLSMCWKWVTSTLASKKVSPAEIEIVKKLQHSAVPTLSISHWFLNIFSTMYQDNNASVIIKVLQIFPNNLMHKIPLIKSILFKGPITFRWNRRNISGPDWIITIPIEDDRSYKQKFCKQRFWKYQGALKMRICLFVCLFVTEEIL